MSNIAANQPTLRSYQHASRIFVSNTYSLAPKAGWLFYVSFQINKAALGTSAGGKTLGTSLLNLAQGVSGQAGVADVWTTTSPNLGMLVKQTDLPKFAPKTEVVNQYNRKTVVQTGMTYNPVNMVFHDDMSNVTQKLWTYYYQYYFGDSNVTTPLGGALGGAIGSALGGGLGGVLGGALGNVIGGGATLPAAKYGNTKYNPQSVITPATAYGLNNGQVDPFFQSITIYQLNQKEYSCFTLVNPLITQWDHDRLDVASGNKVLENKMTVMYEAVLYGYGKVKAGSNPPGFASNYYDLTPSPIADAGNGNYDNSVDPFSKVGNSGESTQGGLSVLGSLLGSQNLVSNALGAIGLGSGTPGGLGSVFGGSAVAGALGGIGTLFGGGSGNAGPTASASNASAGANIAADLASGKITPAQAKAMLTTGATGATGPTTGASGSDTGASGATGADTGASGATGPTDSNPDPTQSGGDTGNGSNPTTQDQTSGNNPDSQSDANAQQTNSDQTQTTSDYTGPRVVYAPDGSSSPVDELGNVEKTLVNGSFNS